jgi:hypothetical protein
VLALVEQYIAQATTTAVTATATTVATAITAAKESGSIEADEYEFIKLKDPPDDDCSIYSKLYLKLWGNK